MFERYTEKARRVIFFARYEASQYGSSYIETEHLLLGIVREDKALVRRCLPRGAEDLLREKVDSLPSLGEKLSTSVDLPLSNPGKRVLAYAAEESDRLKHEHIGTEHLLLGLFARRKGSGSPDVGRTRGQPLGYQREGGRVAAGAAYRTFVCISFERFLRCFV
jgi:ATP-dependent Clp protease ATP-binding subunit ClpC